MGRSISGGPGDSDKAGYIVTQLKESKVRFEMNQNSRVSLVFETYEDIADFASLTSDAKYNCERVGDRKTATLLDDLAWRAFEPIARQEFIRRQRRTHGPRFKNGAAIIQISTLRDPKNY